MSNMIKQLFLLFAILGLVLGAPKSKVDPKLTSSLRLKTAVNIFVKFDKGNLDIIRSFSNSLPPSKFRSRGEKGAQLVAALKSFSQSSQNNIATFLKTSFPEITFKQFYVSNELWVKGASSELINQLADFPEVIEIREEITIPPPEHLPVIKDHVAPQVDTHWNLARIEAPAAWGLPGGNTGQGVVVANIDTGVRHTHETLRNNFRVDYGWFDPRYDTEIPFDLDGHGTHTMGSIAGAGIGVAPGAEWIACTPGAFWEEADLKSCGEWMLCPTRYNGTDPDCSKAPHVISNSWGWFPEDTGWYNDVILAWKAVDIIPIFAAGNEGPQCSWIRSPGDQDIVITVGSTTVNDELSGFSSPGPTNDGLRKPDISAPGSAIYSAYALTDDDYSFQSGTSMATPHVAGVVALLLSRNPNLKYEQVKGILERYSDQASLRDVGAVCGGLNSTAFPNNHYGHGRLNARRALEAVINNS